jgi:hypothetical protein
MRDKLKFLDHPLPFYAYVVLLSGVYYTVANWFITRAYRKDLVKDEPYD